MKKAIIKKTIFSIINIYIMLNMLIFSIAQYKSIFYTWK